MIDNKFLDTLALFLKESSGVMFELKEGTKPASVTQVQYNILEYLYFSQDCDLSQVSACMCLSMPNASREVKKLADKNLVIKVQDSHDKRRSFVVLTDKGREMVSDVMSKIYGKAERRYGHLSQDEVVRLQHAMEDVINGLLK